MAKHPLKVYIAGPYTIPDPIINIQKAIRVADDVLALGLIPFVPHLTAFWHLISSKDYEKWMSYDLEWLKSCDILLRIPGESRGADREVSYCLKNNIPVVYSVKELKSSVLILAN